VDPSSDGQHVLSGDERCALRVRDRSPGPGHASGIIGAPIGVGQKMAGSWGLRAEVSAPGAPARAWWPPR
jgi:hypothetical protein